MSPELRHCCSRPVFSFLSLPSHGDCCSTYLVVLRCLRSILHLLLLLLMLLVLLVVLLLVLLLLVMLLGFHSHCALRHRSRGTPHPLHSAGSSSPGPRSLVPAATAARMVTSIATARICPMLCMDHRPHQLRG